METYTIFFMYATWYASILDDSFCRILRLEIVQLSRAPLWRIIRIVHSFLHFNSVYPHQGWGQVPLTKYSSTPSTPNIYQLQVLVKYSFFKKYLSTSSTFISSTSTSTNTHIKICSKVRMDIQNRINFGWIK